MSGTCRPAEISHRSRSRRAASTLATPGPISSPAAPAVRSRHIRIAGATLARGDETGAPPGLVSRLTLLRVLILATVIGIGTAESSRTPSVAAADRFRERRLALVESLAASGVRDSATLAAMRSVPRHEFVLPRHRDL